MRKEALTLLAKQVVKTAFTNKAILTLTCIIAALMVYAAVTGLTTYKVQTKTALKFQKEVRQNWEKMPDKHPHRMAHYGYIAFRQKHPLSFFDFGIESYTGNAVFLEAHRQNSVNFSEAGFSTGLLRFGEISLALILQMLLPLVIFFIGFSTVASDRENGTLKLLLSQGASWAEIIVGKSLGLMGVVLCFFLPAIAILIAGLLSMQTGATTDTGMRLFYLILAYTTYFIIVSATTVIISAISKRSKVALLGLIGVWLLFSIIFPRTTQTVGTYLHPSPSKIEFETSIEKDLLQKGDSHNPNDPYYKALKDSVLKAYKVDSVQELPFNYSGFQMKEGERLSAGIYNQHLARLLHTYQQQNDVSHLSAFINPAAAIKNLSMAISGTDYNAYVGFQQQAEAYRYKLAQHMNELQIKLIGNRKLTETDKPYILSRNYWKAFPDFTYIGQTTTQILKAEALSIAALAFWLALLTGLIFFLSQKLKV